MTSAIAFELFAPRVEDAKLIGTFSNWQEIPMQKGNDGFFRVHVDLEDGFYRYKFRVRSLTEATQGQWVEVNDPYAKEIDQQSQNSAIRVKEGERIIDTYVWQHDDRTLPQNEELIIYEMHISDFLGNDFYSGNESKFRRAISKLDYLAELGINAVELMPVTEYKGDYRWGYLVRHFFAVESSYGTPEDFKAFVDECHARGIRVIMDGIYNHSDEESPLVVIDRDYWYYHDMHYPDDPANYWGPEFNYENYDEFLNIKPAWKFIGDVVRYWVQEYHIDGIRFDAVRQLANVDFLQWVTQEAIQAAAGKPFYNIAEHIPDTALITKAKGGPMDSCWHESFRYFVVQHLCDDQIDLEKLEEALDAKRQGYGATTTVVNYLASHDREHLLRELGDRTIFDKPAFQRAKLGAVLLLTAPGIPMIWMGDEFGEFKQKTEETTQPNELQWQLLEQDFNRDLFEFYRDLIQLRKETIALQTENIEFFHKNPDGKVLGYIRWHEAGSRVAVVANFSNQHFDHYQISCFPEGEQWHEWKGDRIELQENCLHTHLPAYTAKVLVIQ